MQIPKCMTSESSMLDIETGIEAYQFICRQDECGQNLSLTLLGAGDLTQLPKPSSQNVASVLLEDCLCIVEVPDLKVD